MNKPSRMAGLLILLIVVVGVRWLDPLQWINAQPMEVAAAVERPQQPGTNAKNVASSATTTVGTAKQLVWPIRAEVNADDKGNAFGNRIEYAASQFKPPVYTPPQPPVVVAPPPQPVQPQESPPPLQVIGTWGAEPDLGVFLAGAQGTVLAKPGAILLGEYLVQAVSKQQVTLINQTTQKVWPLSIPDAPTVLTTWPGR